MRHRKKHRGKKLRTDKKKATRIRKLLGEEANKRGRAHEQQLFRALKGSGTNLPPWLYDILPGSKRQDLEGKDFVARTDVGDIFLQVKSSRTGIRKFLKRHRNSHIAVVVVRTEERPEETRRWVLDALAEQRRKILQART